MEKIYLINKDTNIIINTFTNVTKWDINFVVFNNPLTCKIYCSENEYFTDKLDENMSEVVDIIE